MGVPAAGATPPAAPTTATAPAAAADPTATTNTVDANTQAAIDAAMQGMVQQMLLRNQSGLMSVIGSFKWNSPIER